VQNDTDKQARDDTERGGAPEPDKLTAADDAAEDEGGASEPEAQEAEAASEAADEPEEAVPERAGEDEPAGAAAVEAAAGEEDAIAADLAKARAEAESYLDDLRRLQADFDNYRKRTLREQTARTASASQALVARLLPVLDNFELAVSAAEQSRDFDRMLKGVEMVLGALREVLAGEGLVKIEAEGKPFDPERHEAVIAVEQEGSEPGMVVDIVRAGYELGGKVLRPAMVKVAK
jgi:molecular chaperone GrpE